MRKMFQITLTQPVMARFDAHWENKHILLSPPLHVEQRASVCTAILYIESKSVTHPHMHTLRKALIMLWTSVVDRIAGKKRT